ncbi:hypothetical protein FB451DRAFT_1193002 [Mycena latifolia]|nr:hypothetical protein FB451DRAFT_1193002 [Mycena latifolia]
MSIPCKFLARQSRCMVKYPEWCRSAKHGRNHADPTQVRPTPKSSTIRELGIEPMVGLNASRPWGIVVVVGPPVSGGMPHPHVVKHILIGHCKLRRRGARDAGIGSPRPKESEDAQQEKGKPALKSTEDISVVTGGGLHVGGQLPPRLLTLGALKAAATYVLAVSKKGLRGVFLSKEAGLDKLSKRALPSYCHCSKGCFEN